MYRRKIIWLRAYRVGLPKLGQYRTAVKGLESGNGRIWDGCFGRYCPLAGEDPEPGGGMLHYASFVNIPRTCSNKLRKPSLSSLVEINLLNSKISSSFNGYSDLAICSRLFVDSTKPGR